MNRSREGILGCLCVVQGDDCSAEFGCKLRIPSIIILRCPHDEMPAMNGKQDRQLARLGLVKRLREEDTARISVTYAPPPMSGHRLLSLSQ